jgi:ubiquinone/menaquinone biosynthesis C-methylase UbiE
MGGGPRDDGQGGDFKPALRFDALTGLFDPVVALVSREQTFKRRVVEQARIAAGESVLDLGCGTGTLALMAHDAQPGASFDGLDADPAILGCARSKALRAEVAIELQQGFSDDLPYEADRFDVVLSTLFFHHLEDAAKRATASEIVRVLKPGGRLIVADFGRPQGPLMRVAFGATVQLLDGRATTSLNVAGGLPALLSEAGLTGVAVTDRLRTPTGTIEIVSARQGDD